MTIDVLSFGETMLRLSTPPAIRLEESSQFSVYVAGTESNTLAALSRLHLHTCWLSALPGTPLGRHVALELRRHGVNIDSVLWTPDARLGIFYAEEAASPLGLQVYYDRASSACALVDPDQIDYTLVDQTRLLHLTGITPALSERTQTVFKRLLERARQQATPLSFDVNYRSKLWSPQDAATAIEEACRQASILFCTRADAAELWNMTGDPQEILQQMAQRFMTTTQSNKTYVITLGHEGAAHLHKEEYKVEAAFPTTGTRRFGSGDAFAAGYLYAYLNGPLYQQLATTDQTTPLTFGNALAALKRCIDGDIAIISPDDLKRVLENEPKDRFR